MQYVTILKFHYIHLLISLSTEVDLLTLPHAFVNVNIQNFGFIHYFLSTACWAAVLLTNNFT